MDGWPPIRDDRGIRADRSSSVGLEPREPLRGSITTQLSPGGPGFRREPEARLLRSPFQSTASRPRASFDHVRARAAVLLTATHEGE